MAQLKLGAIKDLGGIGGFTLTSGGVTANGTLTVNDLVIDGTMGGSSSFVLPNPSGQSGRFVTNNGSSLSWGDVNLSTGIRSMQVWTSNGTWSRPSGVKTIMVTVTGAGGGGSGFCESGGAGGTAQRQVDVTNVSSVSVSVGNPGGGTNYSGCGGNGNTSSFGSYCSASGGYGANCRQGRAGGIGGNGSGGNLNVYGGGGNGHGSFHSYGSHSSGVGYFGGGQPASHNQRNYAHRHQSHAAWGAGGNGTRQNNRGARGREGVVVVHEFYG
jgi:hypothetical protein|tara:strand:+ start:791 stop:1600 length:810 start_codon:yes stop_codon:yes gene_type:complete